MHVKPDDRDMLRKVAMTTVATKMVSENKRVDADIAIDAVLKVAQKTKEGYMVDVDDIKVEKKAGESMNESKLIEGMILDKEVVHSGMPKRVQNAKIALINSPIEIEKTELTAKINIEKPEEMKAFLDEEERTLKGMVDKIVASKANVLICQKGIDDLVQYYLAKAKIERVVVAGCSERLFGKYFRTRLETFGVNPAFVEFADVRDHCAAGRGQPRDAATAKAAAGWRRRQSTIRILPRARTMPPFPSGTTWARSIPARRSR
jgi:chaperonin GroEL (HSP60 family)